MTHGPQNAGPGTGPIAYATPTKPAEWVPPPSWLRWGVIAVALFILFLFLLGLPPLSGAVDYTRNIPIDEAIAYAWAKGVRGTLDSAGMVGVAMFAPVAVAGLVAFLCLRGAAAQWSAVAANLALPGLWLMHLWPILVVAGPPTLVAALAGQCDGETWSEGFVCYAAMGSWTTLWLATALALAVVSWRRSRKPAVWPPA